MNTKITGIIASAVFAVAVGAALPAQAQAPKYLSYDWVQYDPAILALLESLTPQERREMVMQMVYYGKGSYICSPAGSGKNSRCFKR